jgi:transcriptional regulator with XRE-family HTH domain
VSTTLISAAQIRAARHLANLSQADVAETTGLSLPTIKRAESNRAVPISASAIDAIQSALESAGVEFIAENGSGPGVRLRKGSPL